MFDWLGTYIRAGRNKPRLTRSGESGCEGLGVSGSESLPTPCRVANRVVDNPCGKQEDDGCV